jgi:hypothetical protein
VLSVMLGVSELLSLRGVSVVHLAWVWLCADRVCVPVVQGPCGRPVDGQEVNCSALVRLDRCIVPWIQIQGQNLRSSRLSSTPTLGRVII